LPILLGADANLAAESFGLVKAHRQPIRRGGQADVLARCQAFNNPLADARRANRNLKTIPASMGANRLFGGLLRAQDVRVQNRKFTSLD
jgi:hypothetical protein